MTKKERKLLERLYNLINLYEGLDNDFLFYLELIKEEDER